MRPAGGADGAALAAPIAVQSPEQTYGMVASPALRTMRGDAGGPFKIPANGGASILVLLEWTYTTEACGAVVLYGVIGDTRVALSIAYLKDETFGRAVVPLFRVGGFPFEHYELDLAVGTAGQGNGVSMDVRAIGLVGVGASSPELCVNEQASMVTVTPTNVPTILVDSGWLDRTVQRGEKGARWEAVVPNDATDLPRKPTDSLWCGIAGAIKITDRAGNDVTIPAVSAGLAHPIQAVRVWAAGTAATSIFAIYGH